MNQYDRSKFITHKPSQLASGLIFLVFVSQTGGKKISNISKAGNFSCYVAGELGAMTNVLITKNQLCTLPGRPVQDCSSAPSEKFNISLVESGYERDLDSDFIEVMARRKSDFLKLRIFLRRVSYKNLAQTQLVFRAIATGSELNAGGKLKFFDQVAPG
jgi:hypothetical protein